MSLLDGFEGYVPPEGRLIAQALSDGFDSLQGIVTPDRDSEPVAAPRHTRDAHVHTEACRPLVGEPYPAHWMTCDEAAWQQIVEDVETELDVYALRHPSIPPVTE